MSAKVYQTKDGRWFVQWWDATAKRPVKEYFGRGKEAQRKARVRRAEVDKDKAQGTQPAYYGLMRLDTLAQMYLDDAAARGKSESFRRDWAAILNRDVLPELGARPVDRIEYAELMRLWQDKKQATRSRYLGYLRATLRFGVRHGYTKTNPLSQWQKPREQKRRVHLTVEDLARLMDKAAPHLAWAIEVEWELGTRPGASELLALKWSDVDWSAPAVYVAGTKTEDSARVIPITEDFRARLMVMRQRAKSDHIIEYKGRPIKKLRSSVQTAARKAGLAYEVRMYDIRHLFASVMLAGGGDLAAVSRLLGHADIATTQKHYYHLLKGEMERATTLRPALRGKAPKKLRIVK